MWAESLETREGVGGFERDEHWTRSHHCQSQTAPGPGRCSWPAVPRPACGRSHRQRGRVSGGCWIPLIASMRERRLAVYHTLPHMLPLRLLSVPNPMPGRP